MKKRGSPLKLTSKVAQDLKYLGLLLLIVVPFIWASHGTGSSLGRFFAGAPLAKRFISSMYPPDFSALPKLMQPLLETVHIAIVAIICTTALALPMSFLAARNTSPNHAVYRIARCIISVIRSVPTLLYALIFICMVGLGPFPGILGIIFHTTGALGKYFSEAIENVDPNIVEGVRSTGADRLQVIVYGILPEVKPLFVGYILYYFEYCLRTAAILGIVGAGGIGMALMTSIRLFRNREVFMILLLIVGMVVLVDSISFAIRKRMIGLRT